MKNKKIKILESCLDCEHCKVQPDYTADSFERPEKWICKKLDKKVRGFVEWHDKREFIPDDCPLPSYNSGKSMGNGIVDKEKVLEILKEEIKNINSEISVLQINRFKETEVAFNRTKNILEEIKNKIISLS